MTTYQNHRPAPDARIHARASALAHPARRQRIINGLESVASRLEKLGVIRKFPANMPIIQPGEKLTYCYFIHSGTVVAEEFNENGTEREFYVMVEDSLFGEPFLALDEPSPVLFRTVEETELVCIEWPRLLEAMQADLELCQRVFACLASKFLSSMDEWRQTSSHNATWRICNLLLIFADKYGEDRDGRVLIKRRISQQTLSNMLSLNRITVVKIIKKLKMEEIIEVVNGFYCIRDMERLRRTLFGGEKR